MKIVNSKSLAYELANKALVKINIADAIIDEGSYRGGYMTVFLSSTQQPEKSFLLLPFNN